MRAIRILSDFDGVWTDQALEAEHVRRFAVAAIAAASGVDGATVLADWRAFVDTVMASPAEHGWAPDGRISAYVDEDPLCECSAVCRFLEQGDGVTIERYREAIVAAGHRDLSAFGEHCFVQGTTQFRTEHTSCIIAGAKDQLHALHDAGAQVVVVSNSAAEKLVAFFAAAGIDAVPDDAGREGELRVRGGAGKWFLGDTDASIDVGGRRIHVDRPRYRAVLEQERPDLIIGDVFSLDLALPHTMRQAGAPGAPSRLVLRQHGHTPSWVLSDRAHGAIDAIVDAPGELVGLLPTVR